MATGDDRSSDDELWLKMDPFVQRFEEAWQKGDRPAIDDFLPKDGPDCLRQAVLAELVEVDMERRLRAGDPVRRDDYEKRYPQLAANVTVAFNSPQQPPVNLGPTPIPKHVGRYRVERILGRGAFGLVYLAHDEQLQRLVAIKVPHRELVARPEDAEPYLAEAQIVAGLDHANIVPVYDVGGTEDYPFFVVSKYIEGGTLAEWIKENRILVLDATELVATVAGTLHYAHLKRLVHRDIKPGNILLEARAGTSRLPVPFVADFGLALRDQDYGKGAGIMGTPAYLSPEQASGEGHRVDGRSDIFSLGVVYYELLTGMRPFQADTLEGLLDQIKNVDVRPPRQRDDTIPKELERICLKALSRRASERYTTAKDMTDDLRHFLEQPALAKARADNPSALGPDLAPIKIVPKGLRSFDNRDADFFLELVPGPRDREGLPDSIRFWKTRIEEMDADDTFTVGLIYGPSGCGKSSLVKAGLLPRLNGEVLAVYVEATARDTETRLLKGLRKRCPALKVDIGLKETLAALRRGEGIPSGKKVLIILDQFEQWLHANKEQENAELVEALRQCDGTRVQCLVMVRDDFWLAVSRFLKNLEVPLLEGDNSALVDLFDTEHAKRVLAAFGRAFGKLPEKSGETSREQKQFLEEAVSGLAREGKVICVRLALFAEMMKGKTWTPASLKAVGGTAGVGATFLEETFSAATAPPEHRYHQQAARGVLKALLPESGTDIKGHMRPQDELLEVSGYRNRVADFDDLIHLLDGEIRLITPTDPEGRDEGRGASGDHQTTDSSRGPRPTPPATRFYQLTHDYLVHSLRDWLTQKQKETRRGRAEIRLADRAALWTGKPEIRNLPSWWEWANIRLWTRKQNWTLPQRKMMRRATRYHGMRGILAAVCLTLVGWGVYEGSGRLEARILQQRLLDADTTEISSIVEAMSSYRPWVNPLLYEAYDQALRNNDRPKQLRAGLALLSVDPAKVDFVLARLLDADPNEIPVIRDALAVALQDTGIVSRLWGVVENSSNAKERLRAAAVLAKFNPREDRWYQFSGQVAEDLVAVNSVHLGIWSELFRPVKAPLLGPLGTIFRDRETDKTQQRIQATSLLTDYASDQPKVLADLLMDADDKQFADFFPLVKEHEEACIVEFQDEIGKKSGMDATTEKQAKRQANAAVALLRMNQPEMVWPLFAHSPDPSVRSYLIHYLAPLGVDLSAILKRLDLEMEITSRRALILSLGEFGEKAWALAQRDTLGKKLKDLYQTEDDPGMHEAAEWLLRQPMFHMDEWLRKTNDDWAKDGAARQKRLDRIQGELSKKNDKTSLAWYVNSQGHTMIVINAQSRPGELSSHKTLDRCFAIAAKEVTVEQYLRFVPERKYNKRYSPTTDCPINTITWYDAAKYCRWLSEREGFEKDQMCYPPIDEINSSMKMPQDYLQRSGYRLPTGTEWEYACRAGARTNRYYGNGYELLAKYAWHEYALEPSDRANSNIRYLSVGHLKPNDWGLFDMLGNVIEWCQERGGLHILPGKDEEDYEQIGDTPRGLRGGSLSTALHKLEASNQEGWPPGAEFVSAGFRVVRGFRSKP